MIVKRDRQLHHSRTLCLMLAVAVAFAVALPTNCFVCTTSAIIFGRHCLVLLSSASMMTTVTAFSMGRQIRCNTMLHQQQQ